MTINGINGANTQTAQIGLNQAMDPYSRNIQNQIANAQKQLQELSSNKEMTMEEKMKKRQEIQQQISDLNMQLRQHQMEQRMEKQQENGPSMDEMLGGTNAKTDGKSTGLSQASMTAMISADTSIKQSKVQGSVATKMEGRAGVLEAEIQLDSARGGDTTKKKEELADVKQTAMQATASQIETLGDANKVMEEAAEADSKDNKTSGTKKEDTKENVSETGQPDSVDANDNKTDKDTDVRAAEPIPAAEASAEQETVAYTHVDVRL